MFHLYRQIAFGAVVFDDCIFRVGKEIYQYLQSVQAYVGAPITATFLTGILWKGATPRAALATLILGGLAGGFRFVLDILHKAMGYDLGPLMVIVDFSFLNFSVIVFFLCVGLMVVVSQISEKPVMARIAGLTLDWSSERSLDPAAERRMAVATAAVACAVLILWHHFR